MKIKKLSDLVISKMVAGEVINKPLYLLKELLENSFDANSKNISVYISYPVTSIIKVIDDGDGISKEDLFSSVSSYSTSKISTLLDLSFLKTYGFRGEALFAISSICDFGLISRTINQDLGWKIFKNIYDLNFVLKPIFHHVGTTVIVKNIFKECPLILNYLKSDKFEFSYLYNFLKLIIFSQLNISFKLFISKKKLKYYPKCDGKISLFDRFKLLFGVKYVSKFKYIEFSDKHYCVFGFIPLLDKLNFSFVNKCFFLNKRIIDNDLLDSTIKSVYQDLGYVNFNLNYYLFIEMNSSLYNINLSPKKNIVSFLHLDNLCGFIYSSLFNSFDKNEKIINNKNINFKNFNSLLFDGNENSVYFSFSSNTRYENNFFLNSKLCAIFNNKYYLFFIDDKIYAFDIFFLRKKIISNKFYIEIGKINKLNSSIINNEQFIDLDFDIYNIFENLDFYMIFGFDLQQISNRTILIKAIPTILFNLSINWKYLLRDLIYLSNNCVLNTTYNYDFINKNVLSIFLKYIDYTFFSSKSEFDLLYNEILFIKENHFLWFNNFSLEISFVTLKKHFNGLFFSI